VHRRLLRPTFGGLLNTFELGGGRLERYYHHFFTHDAEIHWLVNELGLGHRLIYHDGTMGIFRDGRRFSFDTPLDLLRFAPLSLLDKVRFGLSSVYLARLADWRAQEETPAIDWLRRCAGDGATRAIWRPMLDIKFGPYANDVPLSWMVGRMRQRVNSRRRGSEKLGYLDGSLQVLLDALLAELRRIDKATTRAIWWASSGRVDHCRA
jgi:protoporphyrinogen oxidase